MPTAFQAGVNSSPRHYFEAVAATQSVDPETVIAQMRKMPVDDFFAPGGKVREDGRMVH
jgi:branched-chain amino acid transport system substrate-binding protein